MYAPTAYGRSPPGRCARSAKITTTSPAVATTSPSQVLAGRPVVCDDSTASRSNMALASERPDDRRRRSARRRRRPRRRRGPAPRRSPGQSTSETTGLKCAPDTGPKHQDQHDEAEHGGGASSRAAAGRRRAGTAAGQRYPTRRRRRRARPCRAPRRAGGGRDRSPASPRSRRRTPAWSRGRWRRACRGAASWVKLDRRRRRSRPRRGPSRYSLTDSAPAMQPTYEPRSARCSAVSWSSATTSEMPMRPPGASTRNISASTAGLSVDRLMTQFEITTSTAASGSGTSSIVPLRNATLVRPAWPCSARPARASRRSCRRRRRNRSGRRAGPRAARRCRRRSRDRGPVRRAQLGDRGRVAAAETAATASAGSSPCSRRWTYRTPRRTRRRPAATAGEQHAASTTASVVCGADRGAAAA